MPLRTQCFVDGFDFRAMAPRPDVARKWAVLLSRVPQEAQLTTKELADLWTTTVARASRLLYNMRRRGLVVARSTRLNGTTVNLYSVHPEWRGRVFVMEGA